ncbi:hypothetical protein C1H46_005065 [Malus baccata]|uniref:Uncharacterized protein n=1 Tax=Malus baccata TaxID=106549 RepID=A0A540NE65_MALBA|nr:hypothetical protein C1H46_005065 [Malus baccata]
MLKIGPSINLILIITWNSPPHGFIISTLMGQFVVTVLLQVSSLEIPTVSLLLPVLLPCGVMTAKAMALRMGLEHAKRAGFLKVP